MGQVATTSSGALVLIPNETGIHNDIGSLDCHGDDQEGQKTAGSSVASIVPSKDHHNEIDKHGSVSIDAHYVLSLAQEQDSFVHVARDAFIIAGISSATMAKAHLSSRQIEELVLEKYNFVELLGRGASAEVHRVVQRGSGQELAMKVIHRNGGMNSISSMTGEAASLLELRRHQQQQVVSLPSSSTNNVSSQHVTGLVELFAAKNILFLVTHLAHHGGDMLHLLGHILPAMTPTVAYSERDVSLLFRQLLVAMKNIHAAGIVHRDLKFENVLFTMHRGNKVDDHHRYHGIELLVADFGLSAPPGHVSVKPHSMLSLSLFRLSTTDESSTSNKSYHKADKKGSRRLLEQWGTIAYFSPELIIGKGYGSQADSWALGCLLVEMLTGDLAFAEEEEPEEHSRYRWLDRLSLLQYEDEQSKRPFELLPGWVQQGLSVEAKSMVIGLLHRDPRRRLSVDEALLHPFITRSSETKLLPIAASKLQQLWHRREQKHLHEIEKQMLRANKLKEDDIRWEGHEKKCILKRQEVLLERKEEKHKKDHLAREREACLRI